MKEPINKKVVLSVLLGSIVFVIIALSSVAYLIGRDVSNQDTSAAVHDASGITLQDGYTSNRICDFNGSIAYCVPKYAFAGSKAKVFANYRNHLDGGNTANWEITVCNKIRKSNELSTEFNFNFTQKPCTIVIKLFPGTDKEQVFSKEYTPLKTMRNFKMPDPTYSSRLGVDYDSSEIIGDFSKELIAKGISREMVQDIVWDYKYDGDICSGYVNSNYFDSFKYSGYIYPQQVGKCKIVLKANVITCSNCETETKVVFQSTKILNIEITEVGIMPSPTSYWIPTITPTNPVYITPTIRVSGTPTPTTVITPSPVVYPTISAVTLYPSTGQVVENVQKEITISVNPPVNYTTALQVRLTVSGATIVPNSYISANSIMALGTCNTEGQPTTSDQVCIDIVKSGGGGFTASELGSFKILPGTANQVVISTGVGHAYMANGNTIYSQSQNLAVYQK